MVTYSHSKIGCFENCPLQFKFRYIDRIKKEKEEGIEAFMGSRVHDTLEKLYTETGNKVVLHIDEDRRPSLRPVPDTSIDLVVYFGCNYSRVLDYVVELYGRDWLAKTIEAYKVVDRLLND